MKNSSIPEKSRLDFNTDTDARLRELLQKSAPVAPHSPWFTRKVMNRLPEHKIKMAARIEYAVYTLAAIATAILAAVYASNVIASGVVTVANLAVLAVYLGVFIGVVFLIISPWIHDSEDDLQAGIDAARRLTSTRNR